MRGAGVDVGCMVVEKRVLGWEFLLTWCCTATLTGSGCLSKNLLIGSYLAIMQQEETQQTPIQIAQRPGYSMRVIGDNTYLQPTVLKEQNLSLSLVKMPDLSEALEQDGGVSYFIHYNSGPNPILIA